MSDLVPRQPSNVVPLSKLRTELAEAKAEKSLPRLQRVIGAATVAAEAQRRVARLADGQGSPVEVVSAAREGARQAATVQLEAMAEAGRLLAEMKEAGQLQAGPGRRANSSEGRELPLREVLGAKTDSGAEHHAKRWEKLSEIPDEVREEYTRKAAEGDHDVTAAGLLRYANPKPEPRERTSVEASYDDVVRLLGSLLRYDAVTIASYASNTKRRTQFRKLIEQLRNWADKTDPILT